MNKLIIFGDSIFKGVTYSEEKRRYIICEHDYDKRLENNGIATENCCKMGATIDKIEQLLARKEMLIDGDTTVLFEFGGNDSDFDWAAVANEPMAKHEPKTAKDIFVLSYKKLIERVKGLGARVVISNLVPIDAEKYMSWISNGRDRDNILRFLGDISMLYRWQEAYNFIVERIAQETDCKLLDVRHEFLVSHEYKSLICSDGLHPTADGHDIINGMIYDFIMENKNFLWHENDGTVRSA